MPSRMTVLLSCLTLFALQGGCDTDRTATPSPSRVPGVTEREILLGSSLALEGHAGYLGTQTLHGALSYLRHINEQGGVHGRRIRVVAYDDGYDPPRCVANTQKLIVEDGVFALFCYVGTPTTVKVIPLVAKAKIPLVGMFTGASALREPLQRYMINIRPSYRQETHAAVRHMVEDLGISNVAVFYQYDAYGFDGLKSTEIALRDYNLAPIARGGYVRGTLDVEEAIETIVASGAEAVVMVGTYDPCAKFIRLCRARDFSPVFHNVSFVGAGELARRLGETGEGVIVTQVVPPPERPENRDTLWGAVEYADLLQRFYPQDKPNFVGLEGFLNAKVLAEGLRRAGAAPDREKFIAAIESIQDYDLGIANSASFSANDHQGLDRVYFTEIRSGKVVFVPTGNVAGTGS